MVVVSSVSVKPEITLLYPPPPEFEDVWRDGYVTEHQYRALLLDKPDGRIHAPTGSGKSRAAAFFAVSPYHRGLKDTIRATFSYPTNILTKRQFERGLLEGLKENLGYVYKGRFEWMWGENKEVSIPYQVLRTPAGEDLRVAKLTGSDVAKLLTEVEGEGIGKADLLLGFLQWLNQTHHFLVVSPDLLGYAVNEQYGSRSMKYWQTNKLRLHSMLRGHTLVIDEYHQYDPYTLINFENLIKDDVLGPERVLLLSATKREDFFPDIPHDLGNVNLPEHVDQRSASREIKVRFHLGEIEEVICPTSGLTLYIHNSVVTNRQRANIIRSKGCPLVQWDGTRKDVPKGKLGKMIHLVLGTSAIEVGLDLDADRLVTEWWPSFNQPNQITQRIGRVGRRESSEPAIADIFVPGAISDLQIALKKIDGKIMSKDDLNEFLHDISPLLPLRREDYISYYYAGDLYEELMNRGYLEFNERLRYSFRPPGVQALFLDKNGNEKHLFVYEKTPILNRYDVRPPIPEEEELVGDGWRKLCKGLHIDIETDYFVIQGLKETREWLKTPKGELSELKSEKMRRFYIENHREKGGSSFI